MIHFTPATRCRASGESLTNAQLLFELPDCPFPGIYPETPQESESLRTPLRVLQAKGSGLVQLGHVFDASCYRDYRFAGSVSRGYAEYLDRVATKVADSFSREAAIIEIGCGDGTLLQMIQVKGFRDIFGIDPGSPAQRSSVRLPIGVGYFPADIPQERRAKRYDLIILRHVLEHVEPLADLAADLADFLKPTGQLWVEVPDLDSTVNRELWSNFYQLHCNYFEAATLDALFARFGLRCQGGELVEIFGGSLTRRYTFAPVSAISAANCWDKVTDLVTRFRDRLHLLAERLPDGCVGYGAAERTAVTIGFCPGLADKLECLYDGNALLTERFLGGTSLRILSRERLFEHPPRAILLFALSHVREILEDFRRYLPPEVMVGIAGLDFTYQPLADYPCA